MTPIPRSADALGRCRFAGAALVLAGVLIISLTVHEASHALTCKHYGARVNSAGLMLYFGLPTAFVDTAVVNGMPYFYVVSATNLAGEGAASGQSSASSDNATPGFAS